VSKIKLPKDLIACSHCEIVVSKKDQFPGGYCSQQCRAEAASVKEIIKKLDEVVTTIIKSTQHF